ncbi:IS110 family transposase, partial [Lactiplantibacillus plajomi]
MEKHDVIGIDVSMGKSSCAIYRSTQCLFDFTFTHTISGFNTLLSRINLTVNPVVYFESTGIYSRPVRAFCERNQLDYVEVNPLTLHFQMSTLRRLKTDRNDAHKIAQYGIQYPQVLSQPFTPKYRKTRELTRFYAQIETDMKDKQIRLHNALQQTFPELEHLFASRISKLALNVIELFPHPEL